MIMMIVVPVLVVTVVNWMWNACHDLYCS